MAQRLDVQYICFYTDGSAARKLETAPAPKPTKRPRAKKQKRIVIHVDPIAILGTVVAAVMLVLMATGVFSLQATRQKAVAMEQYVQSLKAENITLQATYEAGYDPVQVEQTALALGMVPAEQVQHVAVQVPEPQQPIRLNAWQRLYTFLTGLFA